MDKTISVFGSSLPKENEQEYQFAVELGRSLAKNGFSVCTGGYQGIMDAVSYGASIENGKAIGITIKDLWKASPSKYLTDEIQTNSLLERLEKLINISAGYIILDGGTGTLLELSLVWEYLNKKLMEPKPVVCLGKMWKEIIPLMENRILIEQRETGLIKMSSSIEETISILLNEIE